MEGSDEVAAHAGGFVSLGFAESTKAEIGPDEMTRGGFWEARVTARQQQGMQIVPGRSGVQLFGRGCTPYIHRH